MKTVTLADFRPSRRADGLTWTKARIEASAEADANWELVKTVELAPVDGNSAAPELRSFTVGTDKDWLRLTFLDAGGGEDAPVVVSTSTYPFRPTVAEIAKTLRARTYSKGKVDPDDPMAAVAGGDLVGEFTEETRPTPDEVEEEITTACVDVVRSAGAIPGEMVARARAVAVLKTAAGLERSLLPGQAEDNRAMFQTLRMSAQEDLASLAGNLWMWRLANGGFE